MDQNQKKWAELVARAWMDESFKKDLLSNPRDILGAAGLNFDEKITLRIVESKQNEFCFVFPQKPDGNLSEKELRNIAAAGGSFTNHPCAGSY